MKTKMFLLGLAFMVFGCGPDYKSEVEKLKKEQDSLLLVQTMKDSLMNAYVSDLNEIQTSIESLTQEQNLLTEQSIGNELTKDSKSRILSQIEAIKKLIDNNKNKLASIQNKIKKSNLKVKELENMIANLNQQLIQKDSSIALLTDNINQLNYRIASVETELNSTKTENQLKNQEIVDKTNKLHTAYFMVGTYKQLKEKNIITKEGGLLGIGSNKELNANFNVEPFTKIDYTNIRIIDIISEKAELVSIHPSNSYKMVMNGKQIMALEIIDPEKFWQASKYLVIVKG